MNAAAAVRWSEGGGQVISEATGVFGLTWLLVALPLVGAALLLLGGRRTNSFGPALATAAGRWIVRHRVRDVPGDARTPW